jgi:hypothetical protein
MCYGWNQANRAVSPEDAAQYAPNDNEQQANWPIHFSPQIAMNGTRLCDDCRELAMPFITPRRFCPRDGANRVMYVANVRESLSSPEWTQYRQNGRSHPLGLFP